MTIDELCEVIRQRRKRTGLTWVKEPELRELSDHGCCPVTAACLEKTGVEFDVHDAVDAGCEIGMPLATSSEIMEAADDPRMHPGVRAKLIAACCGPLE